MSINRHHKETEKQEEFKDLGFGTRASEGGTRLLNQDGTFNIERRGLKDGWTVNIYHSLITMTWTKFGLLVFSFYIIANLIFACLYLIAGTNNLEGAAGISMMDKFLDAFFFSAQTITTVGYGKMNPNSIFANSIAAAESMFGLMGFAFATGLLYGRFSRPVAKILYSHHSIIAPYKDHTGFMFRFANGRRNALIEIECQVVFSLNKNINGKSTRSFHTLPLERDKINFLFSSWTIVHPINEESPLYHLTQDDLIKAEAEVTILVKAFDDSFSQTVYSRSSYKANEMVVGAKFSNIHGREKNMAYVDLHRLDEFERVELQVLAEY
jgi:inward rectifier potassium channel